jgi:hypothetical protein
MRLTRMTTRRLMIAVAVVAILLGGGIAWYRWWKPPVYVVDPFEAIEILPDPPHPFPPRHP